MKERIALLTVYFPPQQGVAVNRMSAFAKYLSDDYDVEVFTLGNDNTTLKDSQLIHYNAAPRIFDRIQHKQSDGKVMHHVKTLINIIMIYLGISKYRSWSKKCRKQLLKRHQENPFDVVISSFAPVEAHEVAFLLKKNHPSVFWIADMRDEMSRNPFALKRVKYKLRKKELQFQNYIDVVTTVSEPILRDFMLLMPGVKSFEVVRNGFDHSKVPSHYRNDQFTMLYAGTFYGINKPDRFLEMIESLLRENRIENFKIRFLGTSKNFTIPKLLEPYVEFIPKVTYDEAIIEMDRADCNLLFCPPFETKGRYTGKVFDYISVEKPILALIDTEDVASDLILDINTGKVGDFYDMEKAKENLLTIYNEWKNKVEYSIDSDKVKGLHRKVQIEKIKSLISNRIN